MEGDCEEACNPEDVVHEVLVAKKEVELTGMLCSRVMYRLAASLLSLQFAQLPPRWATLTLSTSRGASHWSAFPLRIPEAPDRIKCDALGTLAIGRQPTKMVLCP